MFAVNPSKKNKKWRSRGRPGLSGSVRQIRVRSLVFLLWNDRKASRFGRTSNSEFDEFLLHFSSEETFQPMPGKLSFFYKTFTGLSNEIALFMRFKFFNFFLSDTFRFDL